MSCEDTILTGCYHGPQSIQNVALKNIKLLAWENGFCCPEIVFGLFRRNPQLQRHRYPSRPPPLDTFHGISKERLLPSKLQCTHCGTWVADEGRYLMPSFCVGDFMVKKIPGTFECELWVEQCHDISGLVKEEWWFWFPEPSWEPSKVFGHQVRNISWHLALYLE